MNIIIKNQIKNFIYLYTPTVLLFVSVLNEFDFNNLGVNFFSFDFSYILIFFYSLKKKKAWGMF